jgi:hypothetical protein
MKQWLDWRDCTVGENFFQLYIWQGTENQNLQGTQGCNRIGTIIHPRRRVHLGAWASLLMPLKQRCGIWAS